MAGTWPRGALRVGAALVSPTWMTKSLATLAAARSVAVTRIVRSPTAALSGVPTNRPVAGKKVSQIGSGAGSPPAVSWTALRVRTSPASGSTKVPAGTAKTKGSPSSACWSTSGVTSSGGSFVPSTSRPKTSATAVPAPSVAVTRTSRVPTSSLPGVPAKPAAAGSKASQAGSGLPSERSAARVTGGCPPSKVLAARARAKGTSSVACWSATGWATTRSPAAAGATVRRKTEATASPPASVAVMRSA